MYYTDVPRIGGDTLFSDSHACYLGSPESLEDRIQHLHGVNDYQLFIAGWERQGYGEWRQAIL